MKSLQLYQYKVEIIRNTRVIDDIHPTPYTITENDIGLAILKKPVKIYFLLSPTSTLHLNNELLVKCLFATQEFQIQVNTIFSQRSTTNNNSLSNNNIGNNPPISIRMLSEGSKGICTDNFYDILKSVPLGYKTFVNSFTKINCDCCSKPISKGKCCPICLTVYCKFKPICKNCKTKFTFIK